MTAIHSTERDSEARILADIGGTHARIAWQDAPGAPPTDVLTLKCAAFPSLDDALRTALQHWGRKAPRYCGLAIAHPVSGDEVRMTNHHWNFSIAAIQTRFAFDRLVVINDFNALARAIPFVPPQELRQVGGTAGEPRAARAVIGPGTGLGASGLIPDGRGGWIALEGEGGHCTLAGVTGEEREVLAVLAERREHVSAEAVISGPGLVNLHAAISTLHSPGTVVPLCTAAGIAQAALRRSDELCVKTLSLFFAFLGIAAGNLALTLGARGGVYIGGGIVPRFGDFISTSPFRARFEFKGRLSAYLSHTPVFVVHSKTSPALLGVAHALDVALKSG